MIELNLVSKSENRTEVIPPKTGRENRDKTEEWSEDGGDEIGERKRIQEKDKWRKVDEIRSDLRATMHDLGRGTNGISGRW